MRLLRHGGIYRSDGSFQSSSRGAASRWSGPGQAERRDGRHAPCPSSTMSSGLFLDRGGRHQSPSPLRRLFQLIPLDTFNASIYHRTVDTLLTVCLSPGGNRNSRLFDSGTLAFTDDERIVMEAAIRPFLEHALVSHVLRHTLQAPFTDWFDVAPYYEELGVSTMEHLNPLQSEVRHAKDLFQLALPNLYSPSPRELAAFLKEAGAVRSLRKQIQEAVRNGTKLDRQWADRIIADAGPVRVRATEGGTKYNMLGPTKFDWVYCLQAIIANRK